MATRYKKGPVEETTKALWNKNLQEVSHLLPKLSSLSFDELLDLAGIYLPPRESGMIADALNRAADRMPRAEYVPKPKHCGFCGAEIEDADSDIMWFSTGYTSDPMCIHCFNKLYGSGR